MLLYSFIFSSWAQSSQSLVYDLSYKGQPVGVREINIQYLPASKNMPYGSRILESWTEVEVTVAGKKIQYKQRATGHFSERKSRFVSSVTMGGEKFELQGNQNENGQWTIHEMTPTGSKTIEYNHTELQDISLALFDPGQSERWLKGENIRVYHIEMGDIWKGEWIALPNIEVKTNNANVIGRQLRYHCNDGDVDLAWSDTGLLIDWTLRIMGFELAADIRNVPDLPQFGNIEMFDSFQGVNEEEL
jgi:hypothetical protein